MFAFLLVLIKCKNIYMSFGQVYFLNFFIIRERLVRVVFKEAGESEVLRYNMSVR